MLEYAIFAVLFLLSLIAMVKYHYPGSRNLTTIPGLDPVTRKDGNFPEIAKAGSLHEFLVGLHKQFGPIASFWYGPLYTVSIANAELFKEHQHAFDRPAREKLQSFIMDIVNERRKNRHGEDRFIDVLIDHVDDEEQIKSDAISYVTAGFHTTGNTLTWCLYFLATHQDVQEKLFREITDVLKGEEVDHTNIGELVYTRQVFDETLRCAVVGPWARYQDFDSELGGHKIPKRTPVIQALGVSMVNEQVWPMPEKFDPERFSPKNCKRRPYLAFVPFGFAGKRVCSGQRFAYIEATVALVTLLRQFKVTMVEGQVIKKIYGLVTHPSDEIWIALQKR